MNKLSFASLACILVATACVVNPDDDDATTNNSNVSNVTNATDETMDPTTGDPETTTGDPETTTGPGTTTDTPETTTGTPDTDTDTDTDGSEACGWGMLGPDDDVEFGYICGGDGADPSQTFPMACPADLTEGGDCTEQMLTAEGCCDADGNAWYCQDPDGDQGPEPPAVTMEEC
jgi:hypothetical protein